MNLELSSNDVSLYNEQILPELSSNGFFELIEQTINILNIKQTVNVLNIR